MLQCTAGQSSHQLTKGSPAATRPFSLARFRALLALWCARNHRPFELVENKLFGAIVGELRPGTLLPDPKTISCDVRNIYIKNEDWIRNYFEVCAHKATCFSGVQLIVLSEYRCYPSCNGRLDCSHIPLVLRRCNCLGICWTPSLFYTGIYQVSHVCQFVHISDYCC